MTPDSNTSISAIAAMVTPASDKIVLVVYHNNFAKVPLPPAFLKPYGIKQFTLADAPPGRIADWQAV